MSRRLWQRTVVRYVALQAPGWALAAVVAWWLAARAGFAVWLAALGFALFVLKDFALYPWVRDAYAANDPDAAAPLIGRTGLARERLAPTGYVRIGAELWRAELAPGRSPIEAGASVVVREVRGLTLIVESC